MAARGRGTRSGAWAARRDASGTLRGADEHGTEGGPAQVGATRVAPHAPCAAERAAVAGGHQPAPPGSANTVRGSRSRRSSRASSGSADGRRR